MSCSVDCSTDVPDDHQRTGGWKYDCGERRMWGGGGGSWWIVVVNQLMWSHMITSGLEVGNMTGG